MIREVSMPSKIHFILLASGTERGFFARREIRMQKKSARHIGTCRAEKGRRALFCFGIVGSVN